MNCEQIEVNLIAYLDLKVTPAERRQVETHLGGCPTCRERAEQFRALWSVLDELPAASPSAAFDAKVRTLVAAEPKRAPFWRWLAPSPRLAFAVTLLVVFSVWLASFSPARPAAAAMPQSGSEAEFRMIKNLPVLEDYDVLANFDALSDLPVQAEPAQRQSARPQL